MAEHGVRFAAGTLVSPGEYRNCETGQTRYFDGTTPLPGGVNAASWEQVSDHYHAADDAGAAANRPAPDHTSQPVMFAAGAVVSAGEYRNAHTRQVRYFDGTTPLPGGVNGAPWQQVSDHYHADPRAAEATRRSEAGHTSHPVVFAAGTLVSPGEYRNTNSGQTRFFDGSTPLPGGVNAASWEQISDHHHPPESAATR